MTASLREYLHLMVKKGASDLHVTVGAPPMLRLNGKLYPVKGTSLESNQTKELCYSILTEEQKSRFEENKEIDLSFELKGLCRFRANIFTQRGAVGGAFRSIHSNPPTLSELGLPSRVMDLVKKPRGLILVTGPTGSGKSTTLAAMVNVVNETIRGHIVTIEDPIEFVHHHKKCLINQRELNSDTKSFAMALRSILRQDPDVALIGEMRDLETIRAAITIAETGHLTFATLHTNSCVETLNRIIDVFPTNEQEQVRVQLSFVLQGVLTQNLLPNMHNTGRVLATELMMPNAAIRNLIREDKFHQIYSQMQMGQEQFGMQTMNQALFKLVRERQISLEQAHEASSDLVELQNMFKANEKQTERKPVPKKNS